MILRLSDYTHFLGRYGSEFPYSQVLKTRRRIYSSWLLMERSERRCANQPSWYAVPSSLFHPDTTTSLVVSMQAIPVTPVMCRILDVMERWGSSVSSSWYHRVNDYLAFLCSNRVSLSTYFLMKRIIEFEVESMTSATFGRSLSYGESVTLMEGWIEAFDIDWSSTGMLHDDGDKFFHLAMRSFQYVKDVAHQENVTPIPSSVASSSLVVSP